MNLGGKYMKNRGISLVVLAITIVVLLILASVTISLVIGNNGLVSKTQNAKYAMENGMASDAAGLDAMKDRIEELYSKKLKELDI